MQGSIPKEILVEYPDLKLFVAGRWTESAQTVPVTNPATEEVIGNCPVVSGTLLDEAVEAAQAAMLIWQSYGPLKRSNIMRKAAAILRERKLTAARVMSYEQGKPLSEALPEIDRACEIIEWDAEEGRRLYGRLIESVPGQRRVIHREPLGVIAGFSPWNAPVGSPARKISGPLAAGCGLVLKAAEETPACAILLVRAFEEAGVPKGLCNLVFGAPAETALRLIRNPKVRGVTFTGSVSVGKQLAVLCGEYMKPAVLELGGHAPVIIAEDAEITVAANAALNAKVKNAGQICTSPTRFYVHRSRFNEFLSALRAEGSRFTIGPGLEEGTQMGPVATPRRLESLRALIDDAVSKGAKVHVLNDCPHNRGYFLPLTVLSDIPEDAEVMRNEPFGPVLIVNPFDEIDEAITAANALPYGLAAYAFSTSDRTLEKLTDSLACGNLGLNTFLASTADSPLGGVKDSGVGREGGCEGLLNYTYVKNVVKAY